LLEGTTINLSSAWVVEKQAVEGVTHYGDRLYRVRLCDRTEITASRTDAARLTAVLKTKR
jgi:hypothetical protein